jgi:uncharacterized protein YhbP (UPF0306 family)
MPRRRLAPQFHQFLHAHRTAGLATVDELGRPHAVNLWYAMDKQDRIYFVSSLDSAHSRHIVSDPHVALTVYGHAKSPMHIHGMQLHGLCASIPAPPEGDARTWRQAWKVYTERYPFVAEHELFTEAVKSQCFFRITPTWARWLDNRKGFGFKVEMSLLETKPRRTKRARKK